MTKQNRNNADRTLTGLSHGVRGFRQRLVTAVRYYAAGLHRRSETDHIFLLAGGLAFSVIFCVIPLVLVLFWLIGGLLDEAAVITEVSLWLERVIPYPDLAQSAQEIIIARIREFTEFRHTAGIIGLVALLFTSSALFSSLRTTLHRIYRIRRSRPVVVGKLLDIGLVLLVVLYFLLATALLPGLDLVQKIAHRVEVLQFMRTGIMASLTYHVLTSAVLILAFFLVNLIVPLRRPPIRVAVVSALWSTLLWKLAAQVFGWYLQHGVTVTRIYGAYTVIVVVALWVYYTALVFVIGAELGQLYREHRRRNPAG